MKLGGFYRINYPVRRLCFNALKRRAGFARAFMSSTTVAESFKGSASSKAYGSEQIQVILLPYWVVES